MAASLVVLGLVGLFAQPASAATAPGLTNDIVTLIQRVHQASIVEVWAGDRAQRHSTSTSIRWVGQHLISDHVLLDRMTDDISVKLGVVLPKEPTLQQQQAIRKMAREDGLAFDRAFANSLYYGHDVVMQIIKRALVQAQQPGINTLARQYVITANAFVNKHMQWLLATSLVTGAWVTSSDAQIAQARANSGVPSYYTNTLAVGVSLLILAAMAYGVIRALFGASKREEKRGRQRSSGRGRRAGASSAA